jgi:hypothetical protein
MKMTSAFLPWVLLPALALGLVVPGFSSGPLGGARAARADDGDDPPGSDDPFDDPDTAESPTTFSAEQVDKAIRAGVDWLRKNQLDDGSWGEVVGNAAYGGGAMQGRGYTHPAGATALALYALLKCKVPVRDGSVKKGFEFLKKRFKRPGGSYEASMMLLAICATANPYKTSGASHRQVEKLKLTGSYRQWAQDVHDVLLDKKTGPAWRYQVEGQENQAPDGHHQDLSSTQLASLALSAAEQLGIDTPDAVWEDILSFSMAQQDDDGPAVVTKDPLTGKEIRRRARGFAYIKGASHPEEGQAVGSMTACGIANVLMARAALSDGEKAAAAWSARPDAAKVQDSVEDGVAWLEENWSPYANPKKNQMNVYHLYWLYSVERAMDLLDRKKVGTHLWYSEMGQQLIDRQKPDGSWDSNSTHEPRQVLDTCFALLFLKRATKGLIPAVTGGSDAPPIDNR